MVPCTQFIARDKALLSTVSYFIARGWKELEAEVGVISRIQGWETLFCLL